MALTLALRHAVRDLVLARLPRALAHNFVARAVAARAVPEAGFFLVGGAGGLRTGPAGAGVETGGAGVATGGTGVATGGAGVATGGAGVATGGAGVGTGTSGCGAVGERNALRSATTTSRCSHGRLLSRLCGHAYSSSAGHGSLPIDFGSSANSTTAPA